MAEMGRWGRSSLAFRYSDNLNLGAMVESGNELLAVCKTRKNVVRLDFAENIQAWGSEFSLWDKG